MLYKSAEAYQFLTHFYKNSSLFGIIYLTMKYSTTNSMSLSPDIEEDIQKDTQPQNHPLILLLKLTGLYFGARKDGCFWYYFGIFRALTLFFLCKVFVNKMKDFKCKNQF